MALILGDFFQNIRKIVESCKLFLIIFSIDYTWKQISQKVVQAHTKK
jgi:hypothetical protein